MSLRQHLIAVPVTAACVLSLGALAYAGMEDTSAQYASSPAQSITLTSVVEEDDAAWDCATMGNKICGTVAPAGIIAIGCLPSVDLLDWTCSPGFPTAYWTPIGNLAGTVPATSFGS